MGDDTPAALGALRVDEGKLRNHVHEVMRTSVEETLNALLDAEADQICRAQRYERSVERVDGRAGHYERKLETKAGEVRNISVLVAIGIGTDGFRQILGVAEGEKEDLEGWRGFLRHLRDRGLKGVRLIISDACRGLVEAAAEVFPKTDWQRRVVHFYRNVFSHVPNTKVAEVARMLKAIHAQEDGKAAKAKAAEIVARLKALKLKTVRSSSSRKYQRH